jgi:hypothetical protein
MFLRKNLQSNGPEWCTTGRHGVALIDVSGRMVSRSRSACLFLKFEIPFFPVRASGADGTKQPARNVKINVGCVCLVARENKLL